MTAAPFIAGSDDQAIIRQDRSIRQELNGCIEEACLKFHDGPEFVVIVATAVGTLPDAGAMLAGHDAVSLTADAATLAKAFAVVSTLVAILNH